MNASGVILAVLSALGMGTIGIFSRLTELPAETVTFFRLFLGAVFLGLFLLASGRGKLLLRRPARSVLMSGGLLAGFMIFYIQAMNLTTMANAIMLVYLAPAAASVFAHFYLKEHLSFSGWGLIMLALLGFAAVMEFHPPSALAAADRMGLVLAALSMLCYAGFILVNRIIPAEIPAVLRALHQLLTGAAVILPFFWLTRSHISPVNALWLAGAGLVPGFLAITCAVAALSRLPVAAFGTLAYFEPLTVVLIGWSVFGETLSLLQTAGCAMIMLSGCLKAALPAKRPAGS
ncbi:DMT family transporter [Desulfomicrobium orale]|uniref:Multidrug DMT transporter permease n=1 Tax=Desulfomicrobium orale DSM 12838 TaxID=888061 RepID=A0A0X8JRC6_9BACT|nr:DMT family transporter [Desulfomicrobium orale]AMD93431.1 multidrug DMT transporter permease [Desulfomicrobium orale DSM 12838]